MSIGINQPVSSDEVYLNDLSWVPLYSPFTHFLLLHMPLIMIYGGFLLAPFRSQGEKASNDLQQEMKHFNHSSQNCKYFIFRNRLKSYRKIEF